MKIGIIGGTFNPIHLGHIRLAEEVFKKLKLDRIILIPCYIPAHKPHSNLTPWQDRYEMVRLAVRGTEGRCEVSNIEGAVKGVSYSIDTIKRLRRMHKEASDIFFITGSDSITELKIWKEIEELKTLCTFVIATRPGFDAKPAPANTIVIEIQTPDISSTEIRKRIKAQKSFKELVPEGVYEYITKKGLYR